VERLSVVATLSLSRSHSGHGAGGQAIAPRKRVEHSITTEHHGSGVALIPVNPPVANDGGVWTV